MAAAVAPTPRAAHAISPVAPNENTQETTAATINAVITNPLGKQVTKIS
jgi:hypothetical protein